MKIPLAMKQVVVACLLSDVSTEALFSLFPKPRRQSVQFHSSGDHFFVFSPISPFSQQLPMMYSALQWNSDP